jgi:hypothetical protein
MRIVRRFLYLWRNRSADEWLAAEEVSTGEARADRRNPTDDEVRQCLEEYKFLRTELEAIWSQTYTTLNFMLGVVGVLAVAAYGPYGRPLILLPIASFLTYGAYRLIGIHTTRVWRIVGYMRVALEPKLEGIRWETRLAARHDVLRATKLKKLDCEIFDGHIVILNTVNVSLLVGIIYAFFLERANPVANPLPVSAGWIAAIGLFIPTILLARSSRRSKSLTRGGGVETQHLKSWNRKNSIGIKNAEAEPPADWGEVPTEQA